MMMTPCSQLWTGKPSAPQNLQAGLLELLMVVWCPNQVTTAVMIVHMKVAKPSDGSTKTTMLALHLLAMARKLQDLLAGNCPWRALAVMREAFPGDPLVSKMTARGIRNGLSVVAHRPLVPRRHWRSGSMSCPPRRMTNMTHIASCTPSRRLGHALLRALLLQTSSVMRGEVKERISYPLMRNYRQQ